MWGRSHTCFERCKTSSRQVHMAASEIANHWDGRGVKEKDNKNIRSEVHIEMTGCTRTIDGKYTLFISGCTLIRHMQRNIEK
jgi:hypothetical protein